MSGGSRQIRLAPGHVVSSRILTTVSGAPAPIPKSSHLVHLQFRRFAGCPVCNLHLHSFRQRKDEIAAAFIQEVIVFHSTKELLLPHVRHLPFAVVADPHKQLYIEFGVESSIRALINPRVWLPILRGISRSMQEILRKKYPLPTLRPQGGRFGLPADFLIGKDGRILACKYGAHAYDQWSVDELLILAKSNLD